MNFERTTNKTIPEKIGIGKRTPVEVSESWDHKIRGHAPFSFEDDKMTIPWDWDQIEGKFEPSHIFIMFENIKGEKDSHDIAVWTDDNIDGWFHYRDWTSSGLPFINEGDLYWSGFTFQKLDDAKKVSREFGGSGNWMEGHKEFVEQCNKKR